MAKYAKIVGLCFETVANNCFEQGCLCLTQKESLLTTRVHINNYNALI